MWIAGEQRVKQLEEKIAQLTALFSKGEIGEESYKTALRTPEKELKSLKPQVKPSRVRVRKIREEPAYPRRSELCSDFRGQPSVLWWLFPFLFGILGGIVAYIGVKDEDEEMATNILILSIIMTVVLTVLWWIVLL